jgi:hypothetical protein
VSKVAGPQAIDPERLDCGSVRSALARLQEIISDGVRFADGSLPADVVAELSAALEGLEDQLDREIVSPGQAAKTCPVCGVHFTWPGELVDHLDQHTLAGG